ncbi:trypsin-like peptidase domain-containing protein [Seohaeicola zhoushanensis]|uniref:Serine protease n=1 Tax=Seohaeicola zhoushanensis TaxID=1569283 RepID=A0A8J3GTZ6_9RHOB|nr:trypsin-like peptidase domain-containing protein [Seohaeicola zhoushanensis]GHF37157.1 hypothetical protein GCM10017056_06310 [Seohaeicola zhoushanensis]
MTTTPAPRPAIALEHMTGLMRGALTWLDASTLDVLLDSDRLTEVRPTEPGPDPAHLVARLHRVGDSYEVEARSGTHVWVNGKTVQHHRLRHGDCVEFGETGPICRLRVYKDLARVRNTVPEILGDVATYLRVSRQRPVTRAWRAGTALVGRLTHETSVAFRLTVLFVLAGFAVLAWQQHKLNQLVRSEIAKTSEQLDSVAGALVEARREALKPSDLTALRDSLAASSSRLEQLELRSTAGARVVAAAQQQIVFLQGMYGFREAGGERMLRQEVNAEGVPLMTFRGRPLLTFEGEGPVVEIEFTGTGFFIGSEGLVATNRHVVRPWETDTSIAELSSAPVEPVMLRFIAWLHGQDTATGASPLRVSETADLALLTIEGAPAGPGLSLAETPPASGEEVIVMGYPTGLRALLAQSGPEFIETLRSAGDTDFWSVAARLAEGGHINPLASAGIVGQVTPAAVVYDADTTHGGSGGPVLDMRGRVVAVNSAILPDYAGSNLGVPAEALRALLAATDG